MNKEQVWYGVGGLVLGILLVNLIMPGTWRGNRMNSNTAQCGPNGCSLGTTQTGLIMGGGMMGTGGAGMMNGSVGNGAAMMTATDIDKAFINEMIPHHKMAVMMATLLKSRTTRPEMMKLADDIISAQTKEIEMMQGWYTNWYGGQ